VPGAPPHYIGPSQLSAHLEEFDMQIFRTREMPWTEAMNREPFVQRRKGLSAGKLACGLWELPPGKRSFPLHVHHVTEEALFVISGAGKVRTPDGLTPIGPGDYVSFPPGGPAHQLVNDGAEPLVYLGLAAPIGVDVVEYPDSSKVVSAVGAGPDRKRFIFKKDSQVDYFEGE
jgi:uncharacterized cupin superfamily protein